MGKRAKRDHTSDRLPLDDEVHWIPLLEAVELLIKLTGSMKFALPDIEEMASDELPSMRRNLTTGEWECLLPGFWKTVIIFYQEGDRPYVSVVAGPKDERRWNVWASDPRDEDGGYVYFVSRPHLERRLPSLQPARDLDTVPPASSSVPPVKPATKSKPDGWQVARVKKILPIVYPKGVPEDATNREVLKRLVREYENHEGWTVPSLDTVARARGRR
jgi:hypothetical protein